MKKSYSIKPFHIHIPDADLEDLFHRLKQTRWMPPIEGSNWADGTDGNYLHDLVSYWTSEYDWRQREAWLNTFNHFTATIDDTKIHFIHTIGNGSFRIPLLLLQGWRTAAVIFLNGKYLMR